LATTHVRPQVKSVIGQVLQRVIVEDCVVDLALVAAGGDVGAGCRLVIDVAEAVGVVATVVVVGELLSPGGGGGAIGGGEGGGDGEVAGDEGVVGEGGVGAVGVLGQRLGKVDGGDGSIVGER